MFQIRVSTETYPCKSFYEQSTALTAEQAFTSFDLINSLNETTFYLGETESKSDSRGSGCDSDTSDSGSVIAEDHRPAVEDIEGHEQD